MIQMEQLERLIRAEYTFFLQERNGWSLTAGPQDLELVAHALRVLLHARATPDFLSDYLALVDCQNVDGGWSPLSAYPESTVWVSAFCGLMLSRGNRLLGHERLARSVRSAIDYFLSTQHSDGRGVDPRWADLDTTSHPVSFFNVVMALGERHRRARGEHPRRRGLGFILEHQKGQGGRHDANFHPPRVAITAPLIQDPLVADPPLGAPG